MLKLTQIGRPVEIIIINCETVSILSSIFTRVLMTVSEINLRMENKKKVLIIDDSNTALLLMEYALKEAGYVSLIASSVKEAIKLIEKQSPNLIVLDLSMPEISGYDFLKRKSELNIDDIPIIIVSAYDSVESIELTRKLGAVDFIAKPIRLDYMMEKIKSYLQQ
jgi:DNA-binding NtrC family response regulator